MAAPSHTAKPTPGTYKVPDGYQTLLVCSLNPSLGLYQKQVKPPGMEGGEKIDTTTMHNLVWRTFHPRSLKTLTDAQIQAAYDPDVFASTGGLLVVINKNTSWTCYFPDGSYMDFFAALTKADASENKEGEMPMLTCTVSPTNWDETGQVESGPIFTPASGT